MLDGKVSNGELLIRKQVKDILKEGEEMCKKLKWFQDNINVRCLFTYNHSKNSSSDPFCFFTVSSCAVRYAFVYLLAICFAMIGFVYWADFGTYLDTYIGFTQFAHALWSFMLLLTCIMKFLSIFAIFYKYSSISSYINFIALMEKFVLVK